ncbi:hypothetical protein HPP92_000635 [Vanilla planifolia]|uniref:Uncharacterized protein n=1 Tax=Vanilla planifolia TaxID=51239 RepID=A0A835RUT8_VANPL|nr:hypothetical protein HPP92_000635 [Vanilla planifolia]
MLTPDRRLPLTEKKNGEERRLSRWSVAPEIERVGLRASDALVEAYEILNTISMPLLKSKTKDKK